MQLTREAKQRRPDLAVAIASGSAKGELQLPVGTALLSTPLGIGGLLATYRGASLTAA